MYGVGFQNFPKPDAQQSVLAAGVYTTTTQLSAHMPTILSKNIRFVNQTVTSTGTAKSGLLQLLHITLSMKAAMHDRSDHSD